MPRKKKELAEVTTSSTIGEALPVKSDHIAPLDVEFGREDLNLMRDKINELIAKRK